ncbi:MAG: putative transcriptional regulator [Chloroflexi bacterium]|jgi:hypothetical protein|nr:putative transcriptional regulator [Chloroflexota bacterium]
MAATTRQGERVRRPNLLLRRCRELQGWSQADVAVRLVRLAHDSGGSRVQCSANMDTGDAARAMEHYHLAVAAAQQAADPLLSAYMLGSMAALASEQGAADQALALCDTARRELARGAPPTAQTWLTTIEATALAAVDLARRRRSQALLARVQASRRGLDRWQDAAPVATLDAQLRAAWS